VSLIISLSHDPQEMLSLRDEWQALQARSRADGVYLTWEWVTTWWRHFGDDGELWLLQARADDGRLVGLAALQLVDHKPVSSLPDAMSWRQLQFTGASMPCEHLDFIIEDGLESEVINAFLNRLREEQSRWDVLHLSGLCDGTPGLEILRSGQIPWEEEEPLVAPYVSLPSVWDDYFNSLGKRKRKNQRRHFRRLDDRYADNWTFEQVKSADELEPALKKLIELHQAVWDARGEEGAFGDPRRRAFYYDQARRFLARDWLRMYQLCIASKVVAVVYDYEYRGRVYGFNIGIDSDYADLNVGHIVTELELQAAVAAGLREYDFLWGEEPYKYEWRAVARQHYTLTWYDGRQAQTQQKLIETARSIRGHLRRLVPTSKDK
jgi:CelD/BcsL family acetyltransferase involved in cellulose biosynthesis